MKKLGTQLIVELYACDREIASDVAAVERIMLRSAEAAGATVVGHSFHRFSPHGVSGVVVIQESHLAIHTWPEYGYCAVDIFTCGELTDNGAALAVIKQGLQAGRHTAVEMKRGFLDLPGEQSDRG
jgi:S-adenosylmethionine decarboxylase